MDGLTAEQRGQSELEHRTVEITQSEQEGENRTINEQSHRDLWDYDRKTTEEERRKGAGLKSPCRKTG